jgi:hypothetical protein
LQAFISPQQSKYIEELSFFHIGKIYNTHEKYGLNLTNQAQNLNKTRRLMHTRPGFSKIISAQNQCFMLA